MKKLLSALATLEAIFGGIGCFIIAYQAGNVVDFTFQGTTYYERDWGLTIGIFLGSAFTVLVVFAILVSLCTILENQDAILLRLNNDGTTKSSYMDGNPLFNSDYKE